MSHAPTSGRQVLALDPNSSLEGPPPAHVLVSIPLLVESQLGHYTPGSHPLWLVSLWPGVPSDALSPREQVYWKWRPGGISQEWSFSPYQLHWQGRQMRTAAISAGSPHPTLCSVCSCPLILLQRAALCSASQLRRGQVRPGNGIRVLNPGCWQLLLLPYCRTLSPPSFKMGYKLSLTLPSALPLVCTGPSFLLLHKLTLAGKAKADCCCPPDTG